jgi:excinuclease UvrABC nuclease subunit
MVAKTYTLDFSGYWLERGIKNLPESSGIYGVYACINNSSENTVTLNRLIYLGESSDIKNRVLNHNLLATWKRQLKTGEELCFNYALISPESDRHRAEAAMIYKHKPPCNTEYVSAFPFDTTTITTSGKNSLMYASFTVIRS